MNPKIKNIIIFSVIGLALILVYFLFIKKGPNDNAALVSSNSVVDQNTTGTSTVNQPSDTGLDFIAVLLDIKNIKIDDSIFSEKAFSTLVDSTIELIPDQNQGRPNPFAPIGSDMAATPIIGTETIEPVQDLENLQNMGENINPEVEVGTTIN